MNKFIVATGIQIYCVFLLFVVVCNAGGDGTKRLTKESNFFAFPRIGRGEGGNLNLAKLRNELFAFPRIGRSQSMPLDMKRNSPKTMNTGLWFGPRLGRVQKRDYYSAFTPDIDDYYIPTALGKHQVGRYTPRLARESDEDDELLGQPIVEDS